MQYLAKRFTQIAMLLVAIILVGAFLAACTPAEAPAQPAPAEATPSTGMSEEATPAAPTVIPKEDRTLVAYAVASKSVGANSLHLLIGEWLGYYAEEGLTIEYRTLGSAGASSAQLASGESNFAVGVFQWIMREFTETGSPVGKAFYEFAYPTKYNFGVKTDSGITTLQDLVGLKVGVDELSEDNVQMLTGWLDSGGVKFDDIEWVPLGLDYAPVALAWQRGEVDAMFSEDSAWGVMDSLGLKFEFLPRPEGFPKIGGLFLRALPSYMEEHPEVVIGFGRASCKGTNFVLENLKGATWIFMQMFPEAAPAGDTIEEQVDALSTSVIYRAIKRDGYRSWDPEYADVCGYISEEEVKDEIQWYGWDITDEQLPLFFTNEFSDEINNFDKEAIRQEAADFTWPR
jgi:NitT/TauT family transport system substrate-binding protein